MSRYDSQLDGDNKRLAEMYEFIESMLVAVVENKLTTLASVPTKAEVLDQEGGKAIGRSLAISLATTLTAIAGVDEWIHQVGWQGGERTEAHTFFSESKPYILLMSLRVVPCATGDRQGVQLVPPYA